MKKTEDKWPGTNIVGEIENHLFKLLNKVNQSSPFVAMQMICILLIVIVYLKSVLSVQNGNYVLVRRPETQSLVYIWADGFENNGHTGNMLSRLFVLTSAQSINTFVCC